MSKSKETGFSVFQEMVCSDSFCVVLVQAWLEQHCFLPQKGSNSFLLRVGQHHHHQTLHKHAVLRFCWIWSTSTLSTVPDWPLINLSAIWILIVNVTLAVCLIKISESRPPVSDLGVAKTFSISCRDTFGGYWDETYLRTFAVVATDYVHPLVDFLPKCEKI